MKAVILCAGRGSRLGLLTTHIPKPLLPLGKKSLLEYTLCLLAKNGFQEVGINLHTFGNLIKEKIGDGIAYGVRVTYFEEKQLLGTAGALKNMSEWLSQGAEDFLVMYGDVFTDEALTLMADKHRQTKPLITLGVHQSPSSNSLVWIDGEGRVVDFLERPSSEERENAILKNQGQHWVHSGISILNRKILNFIPPNREWDLPRDVYRQAYATEKMIAYPLTGRRIAIDSPQRYEQAVQLALKNA